MKHSIGLLVLAYFRFWSRLQLTKNPRAVIIGITGSAGKTSTRLAIVKVLEGRGVVKHSAHANSESGIPLNILGLHPRDYSLWSWFLLVLRAPLQLLLNWEHFDYYVVEMGIDAPVPPKNMDYLLSIVRPHLAVVTGIGLVHAAAFDSLVPDKDPRRRAAKLKQAIAKEKMKLARAIPRQGTVILNLDAPEIRALTPSLKARVIGYGARRAPLLIKTARVSRQGFAAEYVFAGETCRVETSAILPLHYSGTFAAALGVAKALGIPLRSAAAALSTYTVPAGRLRTFAGIRGTHLLDSSYNASPGSMREALALIKTVGRQAPKVAIVGDMRELGVASKHAHQELAALLMQSVDEVYLFGPETRTFTYPRLERAGFPVRHFETMAALTRYAKAHLPSGSWVLIKGSQNTILLERAVAALLADKRDQARLCRRGAYWDQIRAATP